VTGSQPRPTVHETLSGKNSSQKRAGGMAQGEDPELTPQYSKKKKKNPTGDNLHDLMTLVTQKKTGRNIYKSPI
jgi:hypothetical protein